LLYCLFSGTRQSFSSQFGLVVAAQVHQQDNKNQENLAPLTLRTSPRLNKGKAPKYFGDLVPYKGLRFH
jgi:hypothetical protein